MKIQEFNGAIFYLADIQNYGLFRDESSPFYNHENKGNFFAYCLTIEHSSLPEGAWLTLPYDEGDNIPVEAISFRFIELLKKGSTILDAGLSIKEDYFNKKDYAELLEKNSSYSYKICFIKTND